MKLLELIVKHITKESIRGESLFFAQDDDGTVAEFNEKPKRKYGIWLPYGCTKSYEGIKLKVSDDALTAIITREELMRAYDLVEQGYTLWFGGDCPVPTGSFVDVIFGDGEIFSSYDAKAFSWRTVLEPNNIVAYRLKENDDDHEPITVNKDFDILGIFHIITHVMPCILAVDAIEIANSLIDEGYHK